MVLMDHMMPGMGGDTVAEKIRANGSLKQPRLILASSIGAPAPSDHAHQRRLRRLPDQAGAPSGAGRLPSRT